MTVEFITMMTATGRLTEAAHVLPYLDTTGDFGVLARAHLLPDIIGRLDAQDEPDEHPGRLRDARAALTFMRDVLTTLSDGSK